MKQTMDFLTFVVDRYFAEFLLYRTNPMLASLILISCVGILSFIILRSIFIFSIQLLSYIQLHFITFLTTQELVFFANQTYVAHRFIFHAFYLIIYCSQLLPCFQLFQVSQNLAFRFDIHPLPLFLSSFIRVISIAELQHVKLHDQRQQIQPFEFPLAHHCDLNFFTFYQIYKSFQTFDGNLSFRSHLEYSNPFYL